MDNPQAQIVNRLKESNNVLVTVSNNPSVDQLAAAIGLTVLLNKMGKHAAAVFSGEVPKTLEFLKPSTTIEKNTDSLRDFIISLDKAKADKLRYKLEGDHVRIFITPYKTSITEADLDFSQGDLNVDTVMALGVHEQNELDQAIITHGRILHDATIITLNTAKGGTLGSINWVNEKTSSYGEMIVGIIEGLKTDVMDEQIATALLTGIVAETERFSNDKTFPQTMSASAKLMAAGANQQLIATELKHEEVALPEVEAPLADQTNNDKPADLPPLEMPSIDLGATPEPAADNTGSLTVSHEAAMPPIEPAEPEPKPEPVEEIHIDEHGELLNHDNEPVEQADLPTLPPLGGEQPKDAEPGRLISDTPTVGPLSASMLPEDTANEKSTDPLSSPINQTPILSHNRPKPEDYLPKVSEASLNDADVPTAPAAPSVMPSAPTMPSWPEPTPPVVDALPPPTPIESKPIEDNQTLVELEKAVDSPHIDDQPAPTPPITGLDDARDAVSMALNNSSSDQPLPPLQSIGSQPFDLDLQAAETPDQPALPSFEPTDPTVNPVMPPMPDMSTAPMPDMSMPPMPDMPAPSMDAAPFPPAMVMPTDFTMPTDAPQVIDPMAPPPVPPPMMPNLPPTPPAPSDSSTQLPNSPTPYNPFLPPQ